MDKLHVAGKISAEVEKCGTKDEALLLVEYLLNGTYRVNVNTGELVEGPDRAFMNGHELYYLLKALDVKSVPIDVIARITDKDAYIDIDHTLEVQPIRIECIHWLYSEGYTNTVKASVTARGLLASLLDGCTYVNGLTGVIDMCYGEAPQSYAEVHTVYGEDFTEKDMLDEYETYWNNCEVETMSLVDQLVDLLLIDNPDRAGIGSVE